MNAGILKPTLTGFAAAAHQGGSANVLTLTSDLFPRRAVGSVVAIGGMVLALVVGEVLHRTGSHQILWFIAGSAFLAALLVIHLLVPRLDSGGLGEARVHPPSERRLPLHRPIPPDGHSRSSRSRLTAAAEQFPSHVALAPRRTTM